MTALTTGFIEVPTQRLDAWLGKVKSGSVVAALSAAQPMKFGQGQAFAFDIGEAEYVAEGGDKGASAGRGRLGRYSRLCEGCTRRRMTDIFTGLSQ